MYKQSHKTKTQQTATFFVENQLIDSLALFNQPKKWSLVLSRRDTALGKNSIKHLQYPNTVVQIIETPQIGHFFTAYHAIESNNFACIVLNGVQLRKAELTMLKSKALNAEIALVYQDALVPNTNYSH